MENSPTLVWAEESSTFHERLFVITTGNVECAPVATDQNASVEGLAVNDTVATPLPCT
jgi:hypothetical protein